jgi:hypothetical protein
MAIYKLLPDLEALRRVNREIDRQELIHFFNENDIDYFHMTDMEMYIYMIENKVEE